MEDDLQQLEAIKKWWQENGRTVVVGVVVGLGSMGGWNWWKASQLAAQEADSARFTAALRITQSPDEANAENLAEAEQLAATGGGTYATLAAFLAAHGALAGDDTDAAAAHLRTAVDSADGTAIRSLAQLRLARVLLAKGDFDGANANLDAIESSAYEALGEELRGDIATARDDAQAARKRYESALAKGSLPGDSEARLRLKLDALGSYSTPPG